MENKTFEDASNEVEQLFTDNEQLPITDTQPEPPEVSEQAETNTEEPATSAAPVTDTPAAEPETTPEPAPTTAESELENAANVAEAAAQAAAKSNSENERLKAELEAANARIAELSKLNEEHTIDDALTPPVLNVDDLTFADAEKQAATMEKFTAAMTEYNRKMLMRELAPELEFAKESRIAKERSDVIAGLGSTTEFADIGSYAPQIEKILKNNTALSSDNLSMEEKVVNAYLIAKGVNSINNPPAAQKEPTTDELMAMYQSNPGFREAIERQRLAEIKKSQQVPPFSASSGAVNAALDIKEEPQTLEEASLRARKMFGAE